jgi:hypothetical protein
LPSEEEELLQLLEMEERETLWRPHPDNIPQQDCYRLALEVDEIFYGGAAGGGKTDLVLGVALNQHKRSLILRREAGDLEGILERCDELTNTHGRLTTSPANMRYIGKNGVRIRFGGCQLADDVKGYQGRPRDLLAIDEAPQFLEDQIIFLSAWLRSEDPQQHCLLLLVGNPPTTPEGYWIVQRFAPWLMRGHPNPASPGEIRYFVRIDGKEIEVDGPTPVEHNNETLKPKSRTFIPARVDDNPYFKDTNYKTQLQGLPEPLRSQMLYGDFSAGQDDDPWQVVPTEWIRQAMERWSKREAPDISSLEALGVDVARGGKDKTVLAPRHGNYYFPLEKHQGKFTPDGPHVAALVQRVVKKGTRVNIDLVGCGGSPYDILKNYPDIEVFGINGQAKSEAKDRTGKFGFVNLRSELYWKFRESLDPEFGADVALPQDTELLSDLCTAKWELTTRGIKVVSKEEIIKKLHRSPDCADGVVYASRKSTPAVGSTSEPEDRYDYREWDRKQYGMGRQSKNPYSEEDSSLSD